MSTAETAGTPADIKALDDELREGLDEVIRDLYVGNPDTPPEIYADAALAYLRQHNSAHVYVSDDELSALDLRSPFNACSLKGRCIETADALDRAHDGHAAFVRAVRSLSMNGVAASEIMVRHALSEIRTLCDGELEKEYNHV